MEKSCTNPVYRFSGYETGTTGCFLLGLTTFETCQLVDLSSIIEQLKQQRNKMVVNASYVNAFSTSFPGSKKDPGNEVDAFSDYL